ncbi:MAG: AraC family transcriptional regulator [Clostridia bacterium]|nr:AraC family transcriptional regulator [Clostridia bacterium]
MEISCPKKEPRADGGSSAEVVREIHEYLISHIGERITIEELSYRFHINPTTLKTVFRKVYGDSLSAHVKQHRMEEAGRLLRETEMSVAEIAAAVGYENQSKFTVAFKSSFGKTPTEYRK